MSWSATRTPSRAEIPSLSTKKKGGFRSGVAAPMSAAGPTLKGGPGGQSIAGLPPALNSPVPVYTPGYRERVSGKDLMHISTNYVIFQYSVIHIHFYFINFSSQAGGAPQQLAPITVAPFLSSQP